MPSITDVQKWALLAACTAVIYTPEKEHFGIVPLEAMAYGRPVIAVNSGGPRETVVHGKTGLLCTPEPASFAEAMASLAVRSCLFIWQQAVAVQTVISLQSTSGSRCLCGALTGGLLPHCHLFQNTDATA